ncbi:MAG: ABC transporter permease, partial [Propionibacteriaceae bacterium]|nr:ABC transporter permease [Propionibacteriaceae bacterium]
MTSTTADRVAVAPPRFGSNAATLIRRNLRIYFRDKTAVFLSLLSPVILLFLYLLFLGSLQVNSVAREVPQAATGDISAFVNAWVFAGMIAITPFTTAFAAMGSFVDDKATGRFREFRVSPLKETDLIIGYLGAGFIVAVLMTSVLLGAGVTFLSLVTGVSFTVGGVAQAFGLILLLSLAYSAVGAFILTFVGSSAGYTAVSTVIGTILGFLAGVYLPIGMLGRAVADGLNLLPFSPAAMLVRGPLVAGPRDTLAAAAGPGSQQTIDAINAEYGFTLFVGGVQLQPAWVVIGLFVVAVVFTA